ncbi:MAG: saccharopine dehydrogenase NADP-binding domain-containing protein [Hyphomicrobiaceae bacterium]|nr:saccharopine dehydrogenase NADP-binding domain-containing protein [Hyphomicrobiaceae bacterium]
MMRVVLIGATGAFGSRLARALSQVSDIELVLTSRSLERAERLANAISSTDPGAHISACAFEHSADDRLSFEKLRPWLIIDASGPFQSASYATAEAAIDVGAHWIDLADATNYVLGFADALGARAHRRGVVAITGASSTPALSYAAAESLTRGWKHVESIDIAIYPGGDAQVGRAVLEAVLSYAGSPVPVWQNNKAATVVGWGTLQRTVIPQLGVRYRAPVATADAAILPATLGAANVSFDAGLESRLEQFGLLILARLRKQGWLRHPERLAPLLLRARSLTRLFANDTGGTTVCAEGFDALGKPVYARWQLTARNGDGPNVPILPALAAVRRLLSDDFTPGARHAAGLLSLNEIEAEMAPYSLETAAGYSEMAVARTTCGQSCDPETFMRQLIDRQRSIEVCQRSYLRSE